MWSCGTEIFKQRLFFVRDKVESGLSLSRWRLPQVITQDSVHSVNGEEIKSAAPILWHTTPHPLPQESKWLKRLEDGIQNVTVTVG